MLTVREVVDVLIYSYICKDCNAEFDPLSGVTSEKTKEKCEKCGRKEVL